MATENKERKDLRDPEILMLRAVDLTVLRGAVAAWDDRFSDPDPTAVYLKDPTAKEQGEDVSIVNPSQLTADWSIERMVHTMWLAAFYVGARSGPGGLPGARVCEWLAEEIITRTEPNDPDGAF